jgi:hypothetical protein
MWTDRHTDMTKLIVAFRNFANAPKNTHQSSGKMGVWTTLIIISMDQWRDHLCEV